MDYGSQFPSKQAEVGHGGERHVSSIRESIVRWIPRDNKPLQFVFDRLILKAIQSNHNSFHLDLSRLYDGLQFGSAQLTEYDSEHEGHYDWHEDNVWTAPEGMTIDRKLSCVLQLTPKEQYEGGRLELDRNNIPDNLFTDCGDVIYFPCHLRHRVSPVTSGVRHSLVIWFEGPLLK